MSERAFVIADGENLVLRYQELLARGKQPDASTVHERDLFVWHEQITMVRRMDVVRASYYTTCVGDETKLAEVHKKIASVTFKFVPGTPPGGRSGRLCPYIFKKGQRSAKTKSVDINITIDALRHTYNGSLDILYLLTGDGDYVPLIQEVMRQGKKVIVGAFSAGLNDQLSHIADGFIDLDQLMLAKETAPRGDK